MKKLWNIIKNARLGWSFAFISITMLVASFILPPTGVIDPSVLAGVGELFAFATLYKLPSIIESVRDGKSVKVQKGDMSVEVAAEKEDKE